MLPLNGDCPKSPISLDKSEDLRKTLSNPIVWGKLREGVQQTDLPSIKGFRALDVNITTNKSIYTWKGGAYLISNFENIVGKKMRKKTLTFVLIFQFFSVIFFFF